MNNEFDIAIVGMACRVPGASSLDEFWRNLAGGIESIARFSDHEMLESGVPASYLDDPGYVKAAPILDEPGHFDAAFFGFSPMEARIMDPQHRILLELAHEALERAGYDPDRYQGRIGVFTGSAMNTYFANAGLNSRLAEQYIPTLIANDKDFLSTRISYKLNLRGPSITVQTACSTSMVAVHLARQSLLSEETDMALAGAISVRIPHRAGYFFDAGGVVSRDAHVRAFDAMANGTVFGSGGGIVVLKRFADALADGDTIHAVIKGSAVNNDGSQKAGYTAPSVNSQADVVVEALANAGLDAEDIGYVEAHGSGTPVGDPIEISALTKAFRTFTQRSQFCAIGSVKTNIGHLDAAAAVAGIIKTVLALEHRQLPPSLNYTESNPEIDFPRTPFYVNTQLRDWVAGAGPRRAGVMSTGMGGTNAHVVLEEAPDTEASASAGPHLLILSAKTEGALEQQTGRLRDYLGRADAADMADVAFTLQVGRQAFPYRRCVVCADGADAIAALGQTAPRRVISAHADESRRPLVFLLPGVGDHYVGMAHDLYRTWAVFGEAVDRCSQLLEPLLHVDIRTVIFPGSHSWKRNGQSKGIDLRKMLLGAGTDAPQDEDSRTLDTTLFVQPALFTIEYATARLWQSFGITPDALVGHSMGEYVAACLAGVFTLEDALRLVVVRARLVSALPPAAMLAVTLPERELAPLLGDDMSVSLINGPALCVVAGPDPAVARLETVLNGRNVICRRVRNAHAFHSRMLDPIVGALEAEARAVTANEPKIAYISNVTGKWITAAEARNPAYWAMHATRTARFSDALHELWQLDNPVIVEVGPGRTLSMLAMQHPGRPNSGTPTAVSSIRHHYENQSDVEFLLNAVGKLWLSGAAIQWERVQTGGRRRRVPLPTYPFERQHYWMESPPGGETNMQRTRAASGVDEWFYVPTWERTPFPRDVASDRPLDDALWLVIGDQYGGGARIRSWLDAQRQGTRFVRFGESFLDHGNGVFTVNPDGVDDYLRLLRELDARAAAAINIVHLGSVTRNDEAPGHPRCVRAQRFGFYSLLHIAQAIGELDIGARVRIGIVSNRLHEVVGGERLDPTMATVLGPCGVIPQEFPNVGCFNVDLPDSPAIDDLPDDVIASIAAEYAEPARDRVLAYRGRHRWARRYARVALPKLVPAHGRDDGPEVRRLRQGGVYLITGGTGGIGLSIAKYLAEACSARILLTKKTPFPDKSRWTELASAADTPKDVARTAKALLEIERLGGEVEVFVADSANRDQMRSALDAMRARFNTIHGVIHAAGIVRAGLIQAKTRDVIESVLDPKVYGTMVLFDLLKDARLDFLVLFSSITSVTTPYAESDYSAANAFLDAFTHFANARTKFHTLTINWPGWKEVGQLADLKIRPGLEGWKEAALAKAIRTADGLEALKRALNSDLRQVIVSPEDLDELLKQSLSPFDHEKYLSPIQEEPRSIDVRTDGEKPGEQPADQVETRLAGIWKSVFGFEHIGLHDNFSQLGGHSLLAMQIVAKMRSSYHIDFTLREFFEAPTIAESSAVVRSRIGAGGEGAPREQAPIALSPMGQRFFSAERIQTPCFLGQGNRRIFAIHHPPAGGGGDVLTVICPPLFNEYMRTQLALRELAVSLSDKGQHVLRFDYRGTGDSFGDLADVAISDWLEDVALAVREGRKLSGSGVVQLLGVRAGSLLACRAVVASDGIERLVLWDPVTDGATYLRSMRRAQTTIIERNLALSPAERCETEREYAGHVLSDGMVDDLGSLDATAYATVSKRKLRVVSTSADARFPVEGVALEVAPFACNWETDLENLMMPKPVLERLGACLTMS